MIAAEDGEDISIKQNSDSPNELLVLGSPGTQSLQAYEALRKESLSRLVYPPRIALNQASSAGAPEEQQALLAQQEIDGYAAHRRELNDFVIENINTPSALYATSSRWDTDYRVDEISQKLDSFPNQDLSTIQAMRSRLTKARRTAIGANAAPLSGQGLNGEIHKLSDLKGNFVLVDFWASWCTPCHVENKHYAELLSRYSKLGFAVFAVNLDSDQRRWEVSSQRDGVTWPQISDGLAWKSPLAEAYNVSALPVSYLLDREGKIIARNLRGAQLGEELEKIFSQ